MILFMFIYYPNFFFFFDHSEMLCNIDDLACSEGDLILYFMSYFNLAKFNQAFLLNPLVNIYTKYFLYWKLFYTYTDKV